MTQENKVELTPERKELYIELQLGGIATTYANIAKSKYETKTEYELEKLYDTKKGGGGLYGWLADKIFEKNDEQCRKILKDFEKSDEYLQIKRLKNRYSQVEKRCKDEKLENGFENFANFCKWYLKQPVEKVNNNGKVSNEKYCTYCGATETILKLLFKKDNQKTENNLNMPLYGKKTSFTATLQIDRKDSTKGYNPNNCVLACTFCNNAKSDMVRKEDISFFKEHFGEFVRKFYKYLLNK